MLREQVLKKYPEHKRVPQDPRQEPDGLAPLPLVPST